MNIQLKHIMMLALFYFPFTQNNHSKGGETYDFKAAAALSSYCRYI